MGTYSENFQFLNQKFDDEKFSTYHRFINPVNGAKRITFSYFIFNTKTFIQNIYPDKQNLTPQDLITSLKFKCL